MSLKENVRKGKLGEEVAEKYIKQLGYKVIDKNWHYSKNAEIDIIAIDKDTVVFIEVKTRTSLNFGHPFEAINPAKIQKIRTAAYAYINNFSEKYKYFRIDGISVIGFNNPKIEHIKNIGQY